MYIVCIHYTCFILWPMSLRVNLLLIIKKINILFKLKQILFIKNFGSEKIIFTIYRL